MKIRIHPDAFDLIVRYETGGRSFYENVYKSGIIWPGGASGPTGGCGYDFAYEENTAKDWSPYLTQSQVLRLVGCKGKTGNRAKQALSGLRDIKIGWDAALEVFNEKNVPREIYATLRSFPGSADKLTAMAFGALVSIVFNRGTSLQGERRREMQAIRTLIESDICSSFENPSDSLHRAIANQVRSMKRLWLDNPNSDQDLVDRREDEATLIYPLR